MNNESQPTNRFVFGSILLHAVSAVTILMLKPTPPPMDEVIEIELAAGTPSTFVSAPVQSEVLQEAAPAPVAETKTQPVETKPVAVAKPAPAPVKVATPVIVANNVDDIEMPQLEETTTAVDATPIVDESEVLKNQLNEQLAAAQAFEAEQLEKAQNEMQADLEKAQAAAELAAAEEAAAAEAAAREKAVANAAAVSAANAAQGQSAESTAPTETAGELRSLAQ